MLHVLTFSVQNALLTFSFQKVIFFHIYRSFLLTYSGNVSHLAEALLTFAALFTFSTSLTFSGATGVRWSNRHGVTAP